VVLCSQSKIAASINWSAAARSPLWWTCASLTHCIERLEKLRQAAALQNQAAKFLMTALSAVCAILMRQVERTADKSDSLWSAAARSPLWWICASLTHCIERLEKLRQAAALQNQAAKFLMMALSAVCAM